MNQLDLWPLYDQGPINGWLKPDSTGICDDFYKVKSLPDQKVSSHLSGKWFWEADSTVVANRSKETKELSLFTSLKLMISTIASTLIMATERSLLGGMHLYLYFSCTMKQWTFGRTWSVLCVCCWRRWICRTITFPLSLCRSLNSSLWKHTLSAPLFVCFWVQCFISLDAYQATALTSCWSWIWLVLLCWSLEVISQLCTTVSDESIQHWTIFADTEFYYRLFVSPVATNILLHIRRHCSDRRIGGPMGSHLSRNSPLYHGFDGCWRIGSSYSLGFDHPWLISRQYPSRKLRTVFVSYGWR